jgi:hypothetical protein
MATIRSIPPTPRHPYERFRIVFKHDGGQRSTEAVATRAEALALQRTIEARLVLGLDPLSDGPGPASPPVVAGASSSAAPAGPAAEVAAKRATPFGAFIRDHFAPTLVGAPSMRDKVGCINN